MKQILIQLDTDSHPSPFDAIAAYDAGVAVVLGVGEITTDNLADIVQGAVFPRGPDGLENTAFWVGGSKVRDGEAVWHCDMTYIDSPPRAALRATRSLSFLKSRASPALPIPPPAPARSKQ